MAKKQKPTTKTKTRKLNEKQRLAIRSHAQGEEMGKAWLSAGYKCNEKSGKEALSRLLSTNMDAQKFLHACKAEQEKESAVTRESLLKDLTSMWLAKPSSASLENPLCDVVVTKDGITAVFPKNLDVADRIAKLIGAYDLNEGPPVWILQQLTGQGGLQNET